MLLSGRFLGIGLVFSGTQHGVRGPCGVVHDRAGFSKNSNGSKMASKIMAPKWAKQGSLNV